MGLRTWVKRKFGKAEVPQMSYPLRSNPWAEKPQTTDRVFDDEKGEWSSVDDSTGQNAELAEQWFNSGLEKYKQGDFLGAIQDWEKAIEFKPDDHYAWNNRGSSLAALDRNEEAIASYDKAIEFNPDFHEAYYNRGGLLNQLGRKKEAIASYEKAIEFNPDFHEAWSNRGNALSDLGRREEAIESYDKAIEIKPDYHEASRYKAVVLNNLGLFDRALIEINQVIHVLPCDSHAWYVKGYALDGLNFYEKAIESYGKAIETEPDFHGAWYNCGISLSDLGRKEEAIESYDKAIEFKPDDHKTWANRGLAAASSRASSPYALPVILNQPLANLHHKHPELSQRGHDGQVASLTVGLTYCPADTHPLGHGFLQHELGDVHFKAKQFSKAYQAYQSALTVLTESDFPTERLLTLQQIMRLALTQTNIPAARQYQIEGSNLYEILRRKATDQRTFDAKFSTFRLAEIDLLIGENEPVLALKQAEFYKNRALTWLLDPPNPLGNGEPEPELDSATLSADSHQLKVPLIKEDLGGSIVYWHQSNDAITTFILTNDNAEPIVLNCDRQHQHQEFTKWKDKWDKDYDDYRSKKSDAQSDHPWRKRMDDRLLQLRDILAIDQILTHLPTDQPLILIPHRDLHRYPIHTLFDRPTTHAPSLQSIDRASHPAPADRPSLLTIADPENPTDPMPYALLESALLQSIVRASHPAPLLSIISPEAANLPTTLQSLKNPNHTHFHFTGHGIHNSQFPNRSALQLTDGLLTASTISQLNLNHQHLAILAACETAIVTTDDTSDYIGIQSAFLRARTRTLISTLWNIDEIASTWFIIHFYQQILNGEKASIALRTTQTWIQTLTWEELYQWIKNLSEIEDLTYRWKKELHQSIEDIQKEQGKMNDIRTPYANPYYWAAFMLVGAA